MGYFNHTATPPAPSLPIVQGLRLWDDGVGGLSLSWDRPLARYDGFIVLAGPAPDALSEVARLHGGRKAPLRWPLAPGSGPYFALACLCGEAIGEPSLIVTDCRLQIPDPRSQPDDTGADTRPEAEDYRLSAIGYQLCVCCSPPQPLAAGDGMLNCPISGEGYVLLASGEQLRAAELPYGLCRCCEARQPLIRCGEAIVCYANPAQAYHPVGGRYEPLRPQAPSEALADAGAIDAALRANSALLGPNGIFVRR
jgi:hypothetical protein